MVVLAGAHHFEQLEAALTARAVIKGVVDNLREMLVHVCYALLEGFVVSNKFLSIKIEYRLVSIHVFASNIYNNDCQLEIFLYVIN